MCEALFETFILRQYLFKILYCKPLHVIEIKFHDMRTIPVSYEVNYLCHAISLRMPYYDEHNLSASIIRISVCIEINNIFILIPKLVFQTD